jgi:hypothetical protein
MANSEIKMEPEVEFLLILPNCESDIRINRTTIKTENEEEDDFKCEICSKKLTNKSSFKQHQKSHKAKVECKICHKKYSILSIAFLLKTHELKKQGKRLNCEKCSKTFLNKENLKEHFETHEKRFKCDKCARSFDKKYLLEIHLVTHLSDNNCHLCPKTYDRRDTLLPHLKYAHQVGNMTFKCSKCSFTAATCNDLILHRSKVHLKQYCKICDLGFTVKSKFTRHMKAHDISIPGKKFKCKICKLKLTTFQGFKIHCAKQH